MTTLVIALLSLYVSIANAQPMKHEKSSSVSATSLGGTVTCANGSSINLDSGTLYVDCTNNRVGVGYTTPRSPLDMGESGSILIASGTAANPGIRFGHASGLMTNQLNNLDIVAGGSQISRFSTTGLSMLSATSISGGTSWLFPNGTASAPGISLTGDTDTGLYQASSAGDGTSLGLTVNTERQMVWNASGTVVSEGLTVIGSATVQGQFLVGASTLSVVNARVGIGTISPESNLHVVGNSTFSYSSGAGLFISKDNGQPTMRFMGAGNSWNVGYNSVDNFSIANHDFSEKLIIQQGGNIGIGTDVPGAKLHLSSGTIRIIGTGAPTTGGALCLNAAGSMSKCTSQPDASGDCTCP